MKLVWKQISRGILKDKIYLSLLILLTVLTSLSFFFVMFSVDGNTAAQSTWNTSSENQQLYRNALSANTSLAYRFLAALTGLTSLVLVLYFYRFFRANRKQTGCLKALGFKDQALRSCFVGFIGILSFAGAVLGLFGGYFLSGVLIQANMQTYAVTGLVKGIGMSSLFAGIAVPVIVFSAVAFFSYAFVCGKEPGVLLSGNAGQARFSAALQIADKISRLAPAGKRFPLRIALRKPLSILLLFSAVMALTVCIVLGRSLNISSAKVFASQTAGRHYAFDTRYSAYRTAAVPESAMVYLDSPAVLAAGGIHLERTVTGLYQTSRLFELENADGEPLQIPGRGTAAISPELSELYGVKIGESLPLVIAGAAQRFVVAEIAINAIPEAVYVNGNELSEILGVSPGTYNGVLSMEAMDGGETVTKAQRLDCLARSAVSNNVSAVINQVTGGLVGAVLLFLALYVNFQDNIRDVLILSMMGFQSKEIHRMLTDIYRPILWAAFAVTLAPNILLARAVQHSLSISLNDYMPFGTDMAVIAFAFLLLSLIYWLVQAVFRLLIKRSVDREKIAELIYSE